MNNLTLGNDAFTYYETIGGGQGACPDADGPSGVHVAMSNTLNTPIEALELEFPLRVTEYSIRARLRRGGADRGGDGVVREIEALTGDGFSLLTERRRHAPRGRAGGGPGAPGRNLLERAGRARRSCRQGARAGSRRATGCGSRRPEAAATAGGPGRLTPRRNRPDRKRPWSGRAD